MKLLRLLSLFILPLFFSACYEKDSNTIKIGILEGPSAVSFIKMIDQPPTIAGRKVEFIIKSEPIQIQALMMQNQLDFAVLPTIMAANLYNKGVDFRLLAIPIWGTLYLISSDSAVQHVDDIENCTVYVFGQGTTADILFQDFIQKQGMQNVKIDYSYNTNQEISAAILHQKIKLAIVSEPMTSVLLAKDAHLKIITKITCEENHFTNNENIFAQTALLLNNRLSSNYTDIIQAITVHYSASCDFTSQQTEEAAKLLVQHGYYPDLKTATLSIPLCNIKYSSAAEAQEKIKRYLNIFHTFEPKSIGGKIPDDAFFFTGN